jgi:hypothetical protein
MNIDIAALILISRKRGTVWPAWLLVAACAVGCGAREASEPPSPEDSQPPAQFAVDNQPAPSLFGDTPTSSAATGRRPSPSSGACAARDSGPLLIGGSVLPEGVSSVYTPETMRQLEHDRGTPPCSFSASEFLTVLGYYCSACHEVRPTDSGYGLYDGFGTIYDLDAMVRSQLIVPGDAAASRVLTRVADHAPLPRLVAESTQRLLARFVDELTPIN